MRNSYPTLSTTSITARRSGPGGGSDLSPEQSPSSSHNKEDKGAPALVRACFSTKPLPKTSSSPNSVEGPRILAQVADPAAPPCSKEFTIESRASREGNIEGGVTPEGQVGPEFVWTEVDAEDPNLSGLSPCPGPSQSISAPPATGPASCIPWCLTATGDGERRRGDRSLEERPPRGGELSTLRDGRRNLGGDCGRGAKPPLGGGLMPRGGLRPKRPIPRGGLLSNLS